MANPRVNWQITAEDRTTAVLKNIDRQVSGLAKSFKDLGGFVGFATITSGITALVAKATTLAGTLQDVSERFGVSSEFLQRLNAVASESGASLDSINGALRALAKTSEAAAAGGEEAAKAFASLGISARQLQGVSLDRRFLLVANALAKVPDAASRAAIGTKLLGKGFTDLLPVLPELELKMAKVTSIAGDDQVKAVDEAADAWKRFTDGIERRTIGVLGDLILAVEQLQKGRSGFADTLRQQQRIMEGLGDSALSYSEKLKEAKKRQDDLRSFSDIEPIPKGPGRRRNTAGVFTQGAEEDAKRLKDAQADIARILKATESPLEKYRREVERVQDLQKNWGLSTDAAAREIQRLGEVLSKELKVEIDDSSLKKAQSDIAEIIQQTQTPLERYQAGVARVSELHERWGLSAELTTRELERLGGQLSDEVQALADASSAGQQWNEDLKDTAAIIESLKSPFDRLVDAYTRIDELASRGNLTPELVDKAKKKELEEYLQAAEKQTVEVSGRLDTIFKDIADNTSGLAADITSIFFDTTESIGDMFDNLLNRIAQAIVQKNVVQPLIDQLAGLAASFFSSGSIQEFHPTVGKRALGGPVGAGQPYLVGESGPELFVPKTSGDIIPNGSGVSPPPVQINVTSLDPRGAAAVIAGNEDVIVAAMRRAYQRAGRLAPI